MHRRTAVAVSLASPLIGAIVTLAILSANPALAQSPYRPLFGLSIGLPAWGVALWAARSYVLAKERSPHWAWLALLSLLGWFILLMLEEGSALNAPASAQALAQPGEAEPQPLPDRASLPPVAAGILASTERKLGALSISDEGDARAELESANAARRRVWGEWAVDVPVERGSAGETLAALTRCLTADYATGGVMEVTTEDVEQLVGAGEEQMARARTQMEHLDPALRAQYERRLVKHAQRGAGAASTLETATRKLVVKVHFRQSFGTHQIVRVDADAYLFMGCSKRGRT